MIYKKPTERLYTLVRKSASRATGLAIVVSAAMIVSALAAPAPALAGSRDIEGCTDVYLTPSAPFCDNTKGYHEYYYEVESWNTNGEGVGSCAGVGSSLGIEEYGWHCVGEIPSGYDESYCIQKCEGLAGYGFVNDNSSVYASYFTGWVWWAY